MKKLGWFLLLVFLIGNGAFLLTLTLEGEVILSESHFSAAQALERASSLRILLSNWEHTL